MPKALSDYTIIELKEMLLAKGLPTGGNKAELVKRLSDAEENVVAASGNVGETVIASHSQEQSGVVENADRREFSSGIGTSYVAQKEFELLRLERDLLQREVEIMRRERELQSSPAISGAGSSTRSTASVQEAKSMLNEFNGVDKSFQRWVSQVELLRATCGLDDNATKALISSKLKGQALSWWHSIPEHINMPVDELIAEMKVLYDHGQSKKEMRKQFEERNWKRTETFSEYFHDKLILANYIRIDEDEVIDHIIDGIPDHDLRDHARLQNFESRNALLRAFERISIRDRNFQRPARRDDGRSLNPVKKDDWKTSRGTLRCFNCGDTGHISPNCPKPRRNRGTRYNNEGTNRAEAEKKTNEHQVTNVHVNTEDNEFYRNVEYQLVGTDDRVRLSLDTLIDTGSPVSFIKQKFIPIWAIEKTTEFSRKFCGINDTELIISGVVKLSVLLDQILKEGVVLFIVPDNTMKSSVVLGRDALKSFGFTLQRSNYTCDEAIREILNIEQYATEGEEADSLVIQSDVPESLKVELKRIFINDYVKPDRPTVPKVNAEICLRLKEHQSFHFSPRRLSYLEKEALRKILNDLLEKNVIRPSESEYSSPIVLVKKKNSEYRLCIDYRTLNKLLVKDNYPLPLIEDQLDVLNNKKYFTLMDLKDGFHHIRVADESIKYTSFVTPLGQYEYLKMPFGLKTAPTRFQKFVNEILKPLIESGDVVAYIDDFLVATETVEHHLFVLKSVFKLCVDNRLELRIDKCRWLHNEIEYLGYLISDKGISPTNNGIQAVLKFPIPQNVRDVRSFVGLSSYFRKFIQNFSVIAKPLHELLRKNATFKFGEDELKAFDTLKRKLTEAPVLGIYDPRCETELHCDASSLGFGAVLIQRKEDLKFHPIFYFSKRTTETESKYHSFELETLAIVYALRRFRVYLHGIRFKILTDCNSLTLTLNKKDVNPRISRWVLEMQNYDYVAEHRSNTRMTHVDGLSRAGIFVVEENSLEFNLSVCQNQDPNIRELQTKLENTEDKLFEMRDGLIYRKLNGNLMFYVPKSMETSILVKYHDQMGHVGVDKVVENIQRHYWFPKIREKVKDYIRNCLKCIVYSPLSGKREGFLQIPEKGNLPFETLHIDHCGPIVHGSCPNKHILIIIDAFTKFVKLYSTNTTASKEAIKYIKQYFANYSKPKVIITDRGSCFMSHEFQEFLRDFQVTHVKIATASPQANGQVERVNRVIGPMLAKLDETGGKQWYKALLEIEYAINNTVNKSTGETPCRLLFGIEQRGEINDNVKEYLRCKTDDSRNLEIIRGNASKNTRKAQEYNKRYVDNKRKTAHQYKVGDYVALRNFDSTPGVSQKLLPRFKGPYEIIRELRNNRYCVADVKGFQITQKPYQGVWEPANMRPWRSSNNVCGNIK